VNGLGGEHRALIRLEALNTIGADKTLLELRVRCLNTRYNGLR